MTTWIEEHPSATRLERIEALAHALIGRAEMPSAALLEYYGLEEDFELTDEPTETCLAFDAIVMRCEACDWWCEAEDVEDGKCSECREADDE